VTEAVLIEHCW